MRPRLTWKVRRWSEAAFITEHLRQTQRARLESLRAIYGDAVADAAEMVAHMVWDRGNRPSAQDIKHTLNRIIEAPAGADLRRIDGYAEAALATVALQQHRTTDLRTLTPQQLADCARLALQRPRRASGTKQSGDLAFLLVTTLLRIAPESAPAKRDTMLHEALLACDLGAGLKTVERHLTKARAGKVL